MGEWSNLTQREKSNIIRFAIKNGVSDINTIRDTFNVYASGNGGENKYKEGGGLTENDKMALSFKAQRMSRDMVNSMQHFNKGMQEFRRRPENEAIRQDLNTKMAAQAAANQRYSEIVYAPQLDENWDWTYRNNVIGQRGSMELGFSDPLFIALTGGASLANGAVKGTIGGIKGFRTAHPFLTRGIDLGLTADGVKNALSGNGVQKTIRLINEGKYEQAALSGLVDVLDVAGGVGLANDLYKLRGAIPRTQEALVRAWDQLAKHPKEVLKAQLLGNNKAGLKYIIGEDKNLAYNLPYHYSGNSVGGYAHEGDAIDVLFGKTNYLRGEHGNIIGYLDNDISNLSPTALSNYRSIVPKGPVRVLHSSNPIYLGPQKWDEYTNLADNIGITKPTQLKRAYATELEPVDLSFASSFLDPGHFGVSAYRNNIGQLRIGGEDVFHLTPSQFLKSNRGISKKAGALIMSIFPKGFTIGKPFIGSWDYAVPGHLSEGGSIHIAPSKKGTFTAAATKHGKSVQEFARQVLANKENYSPAMVRKAVFAHNSKSWKHSTGGPLYPFSFQKNPYWKTPVVRYDMGGHLLQDGGYGVFNEDTYYETLTQATNEWIKDVAGKHRFAKSHPNTYQKGLNAEFWDRLMAPNIQTIDDWEHKGGVASHKLSYAEADGKYYVYPEIQMVDGKLIDYTDPKNKGVDSFKQALQTNNYIVAPSEEIAANFTKSYKQYPAFTGMSQFRDLQNIGDDIIYHSNPKKIDAMYNAIIKAGYSPVQASGIIGSALVESRMNEYQQEVGNSGKGYGLMQWTDKTRRANLDAYKPKGVKTEFERQVGFMLEELKDPTMWVGGKKSIEAFMNAETVEDAVKIFAEKYEHPKDAHMDRRVAVGKLVHSQKTNKK